MAGESLKFLLELTDKMSGPAKNMSKALVGVEAEMKSLQRQMAVLDATAEKDPLKKRLKNLKIFQSDLLATADAAEAANAANALPKFSETLGEIGGFLGPLIAVSAAMAALTGAALLGGASLAVHASEAKNDTLDVLDAMLGSEDAARQTYADISAMGSTIGLSLSRGQELARELSLAGVTNADALTKAVKTIGEVESVLGKEAGGKIQKILEKTSQTGEFKISSKQLTGTGIVSADLERQLSKQMGVVPEVIKKRLAEGKISAQEGTDAITALLDEKFGKLAGQQALDFGVQLTTLKDNISKLFEDVDPGPFMDAFHGIVQVFDTSTESGKAFKFLIESVFNGLFKVVAKVGPYITTFLKGMAIIGLKIYIAMKPLIKTISDAFGGDNASALDTFAGFMSGVGTAVAFVITQVTPLIQAFIGLLGWFYNLEQAIVGLVASFYEAGGAIITGLVTGFTDGGSQLYAAMKNVASNALNTFKATFGIASPSSVMAKMGGHLMTGLEKGISANDSGPGGAMADAVTPAAVAGKGGGGSTAVTFGAGSIVITVSGANGAEIAAQLQDALPAAMAAAFESMSITAGAA